MSIRARLRSSLAVTSQQPREENGTNEVYSEDLQLEEGPTETEMALKQAAALRTKLKKLGITNIEEHMRKVIQLDANKSRHTRSNNKSADTATQATETKTIVATGERPLEEVALLGTKKRLLISSQKASTRKNRKGLPRTPLALNSKSALLWGAKLSCRKSSSEYDSNEDDLSVHKKPRKVAGARNSSKDDTTPPNSHQDSDSDESHLVDDSCKVPGCDSKGHLSGAFESHNIPDTCPVFHNKTAEECAAIYRKRLDADQKKHKETPSKLRKSPIKRNRVLDSDPKWTGLMEERKAQMTENSLKQTGEVMSMVTSSRQPNLVGFTPTFDLDLFIDSQSRTGQMRHWNSAIELKSDDDESAETEPKPHTGVQSIVMGKRQIDVWYASPYSDDFHNCQKLFICEFCLRCMNASIILQRHANKCLLRHPPGREIYRKGNISFFEIDGNKQKEYCQNLCLLAKLFLDHKTLFFDVEPFLFYIMTECDQEGMHLMGYFSKEKHSSSNYNVSCILTLPSYQRAGYGRMLIEFSYLLTKAEGKVGSPERPLSDLGLISYRSYWKFAIMEYLSTYEGKDISLKDMSQQTGINATDIVSTLQLMGLCKYWKGNHLILLPPEAKDQFVGEVKKRRKTYADKVIDPKCLSWTPSNWSMTKK